MTARNDRIDNYRLAGREALDFRPYRVDDAGRFMSHHDRITHAGMLAGVDTEIRVAYRGRRNAHHYIVRFFENRLVACHDIETPRCFEHRGAHCSLHEGD